MPKTVQTIFRHSQVCTTMARYIIPDKQEMADAMNNYDEFLAMLEAKRGPLAPPVGGA